jgi:hypothetical protein
VEEFEGDRPDRAMQGDRDLSDLRGRKVGKMVKGADNLGASPGFGPGRVLDTGRTFR